MSENEKPLETIEGTVEITKQQFEIGTAETRYSLCKDNQAKLDFITDILNNGLNKGMSYVEGVLGNENIKQDIMKLLCDTNLKNKNDLKEYYVKGRLKTYRLDDDRIDIDISNAEKEMKAKPQGGNDEIVRLKQQAASKFLTVAKSMKKFSEIKGDKQAEEITKAIDNLCTVKSFLPYGGRRKSIDILQGALNRGIVLSETQRDKIKNELKGNVKIQQGLDLPEQDLKSLYITRDPRD